MIGVILCSSRAALERGEELVGVGDQDVGGAHELHVEAGVEHVRRGHALVHEARLRADDLRQMRQEGDDVVLDLGLDGVDARDIEGRGLAFLPDLFRRLFRDLAEFGHGVGGMRFDLEPDAKARLGRPDRSHFGAAVARNHEALVVAGVTAVGNTPEPRAQTPSGLRQPFGHNHETPVGAGMVIVVVGIFDQRGEGEGAVAAPGADRLRRCRIRRRSGGSWAAPCRAAGPSAGHPRS